MQWVHLTAFGFSFDFARNRCLSSTTGQLVVQKEQEQESEQEEDVVTHHVTCWQTHMIMPRTKNERENKAGKTVEKGSRKSVGEFDELMMTKQ